MPNSIILNPLVFKIIRNLNPVKYKTLGDITISNQGLSPSRFKITEDTSSGLCFPYLKSGNVYNYNLIINETYNTSLKGIESLVPYYEKKEKILIRRIINRQDRLTVGYTNERLVFKKDINPFIVTNKNFLTKYILAILASKFISYYYINVSAIALKDDFRQTTLTELRDILIPIIEISKQEKIVKVVNKILDIKKANPQADTTTLEAEIDKMVNELYELTEEEISIIENS